MIHTYTLNGLQIQTGNILCLAFHGDPQNHPVSPWRLLGLLIPGEVDHFAVYIGPDGRCVESAYRGVYEFQLGCEEWKPKRMYKYRGRFKDDFVGAAFPLWGVSYRRRMKTIFGKTWPITAWSRLISPTISTCSIRSEMIPSIAAN